MSISVSVLRGLNWLGTARLAGQVIAWITTLFVIRLLMPEDYGLMAMAAIPLFFAEMLGELGVGTVLVQRSASELDDRLLRSVASLAYLLGIGLGVLLLLSSSLIASTFREPKVATIVTALAIVFPINSLRLVPEAMLWRNMEFKKKASAELIAAVFAALLTLVLAVSGFGVWALVGGVFATSIMRTSMILYMYGGWIRPTSNLRGLRDVLHFGAWLIAEKIMFVVYARTDAAVVARIMGTEPTGVLSVASNLATLPMQKVNGIINDLSLPAFSRVRERGEGIARHLSATVSWMSLIAFPVFFGMSAVAEPLVLAVLGEKWIGAVPLVSALSVIVPLQMVANIFSMAMQSLGRPQPGVGSFTATSIMVGTGIWWFSPRGLEGVAIAWLISYPIVFIAYLTRMKRWTGFGPYACASAMFRPALCASLMWLSVHLIDHWAQDRVHPFLQLMVQSAAGAAVYSLLALVWCRDELNSLRNMLGRGRG